MTSQSPIQAIKYYCLHCNGGSYKATKDCEISNCSLHRYRLGKDIGGRKLKAIREFCLECMSGCKATVKNCPSFDCHLYSFRFGTNPNRKGVGGNPKLLKNTGAELVKSRL